MVVDAGLQEKTRVDWIIGSKKAARDVFRNGLIEDGEAWMEMIKSRNLSSHSDNMETAEAIVTNILTRFWPRIPSPGQGPPILVQYLRSVGGWPPCTPPAHDSSSHGLNRGVGFPLPLTTHSSPKEN